MSITIKNFDNYINQHRKIFIYQLNSDPYAEPELKNNKKLNENNYTDDKQIDINYKFNVMNISNNNVIA